MMLMNYMRPMLPDAFDMRVDHLFDEAIRSVGGFRPTKQLSWNVYEKDGWFWIDAAVPGLTKKDVDVQIADGILTMSVTHPMSGSDDAGPNYFVREIGCETVSRSMKLPDLVDLDKATATCKDGMLSVGFPKRAEMMARHIPIEEKLAA